MNAGSHTGGFGRRTPGAGGAGGGFGGLHGGGDPNPHDEIRNDSGIGRFIGVFALVMLVIGLGGGFTVRAEEKEKNAEDGPVVDPIDVWRLTDGRIAAARHSRQVVQRPD
jgi:hypothetical protein